MYSKFNSFVSIVVFPDILNEIFPFARFDIVWIKH